MNDINNESFLSKITDIHNTNVIPIAIMCLFYAIYCYRVYAVALGGTLPAVMYVRDMIDHHSLPNLTVDDMVYDMSPIRDLPVIFVNGVPGAGNQTVAQTISNITGYSMIRPGDLVRAEAQRDTTRGRLINERLVAQEDIPEQTTVDLIKEAMLAQKDAIGFILVGFPKNPRMSTIFNRQVKWPEKIVALEVDNEVAATRLQNKLSELGRPASEINAARQIVKEAAHKVKNVHKRFGGHVITLDSTGNPKALATTLKEILTDTMQKHHQRPPPSPQPAAAASASAPVAIAILQDRLEPPAETPAEPCIC